MKIICYNKENEMFDELDEFDLYLTEQYFKTRYNRFFETEYNSDTFVMVVANFSDARATLPLESLLLEKEIPYANWESDPCDLDGLATVVEEYGVTAIFCTPETKEQIATVINKGINYYRI